MRWKRWSEYAHNQISLKLTVKEYDYDYEYDYELLNPVEDPRHKYRRGNL